MQSTSETISNTGISATEARRSVWALAEVLRAECRDWNISPRAAGVLFLLPLVVAVAVALTGVGVWYAVVDRSIYNFITDEDSILEWAQVAGYAGAALCAALLALHFRRSSLTTALLFLLFALGCLFIAGEEISWGQRLLRVETPDQLAQVNMQGETTVHNISTLHEWFGRGLATIGLYGSVLAAAIRLLGRNSDRALIDRFVPPLFLTSSFLVMFVYRHARVIVFPYDHSMVGRYGEAAEFALAFGLLLFSGLLLRRLRLRRPDGAPSPQSPS
jgi:hypothetical protein